MCVYKTVQSHNKLCSSHNTVVLIINNRRLLCAFSTSDLLEVKFKLTYCFG